MTREEIIRVFEKMQDAFLKDTEFRNAIDSTIEILSQPSLPSNLDEAAEEYAYNNWEDNDYHTGASEGLPFDAIGHTEKCFKAGAEWMYLWMIKEFVVIREVDLQELLDHRIKEE